MEAADEDGAVVRLPSGRARVVLAMLCAEAGREVSSDRLIDLAWNGNPPPTSATQLHGLISSLRRAFGSARDAIVTGPDGYVLRADVDLARMRELITLARHGMEGGNLDAPAAILSEALALWRGRPFTGLNSGDLATAGDLIEQEYVSALEDYAETELRRGNHALLTQRLAGWVSAYPLRENLHGSYIVALARSGRQAEAIATYHQLRQHLTEDLGVDPGQRLQALYQQVLSGDLDTPGPDVPRPAQLPATISDFTGRAEQVATLLDALAGDECQPAALVISAVSGIGGIGKSVLAVHVAHRAAADFPDGQLYVNLAGASADRAVPAEVLARLLRDLGVPAGQVPADADERAARYRSLLAGRRVLIVLDDARDAAQVRPLCPVRPAARSSSPAGRGLRISPARSASTWTNSIAPRHESCSPGSSARAGYGRSPRRPSRFCAPAQGCRWRSVSSPRSWAPGPAGASRRWQADWPPSMTGSPS